MDTLHAIILGVVQGLTEFLPVSSSGHLQLVPWLFGWDDFAGNEELEKAFDVAVHLGTLVGAVAYLRHDVIRYSRAGVTMAITRRPSPDGTVGWLLLATVIPAALVGVVAEGLIERLDDDIWLTAVTLIVFGLLLLAADRMGGQRSGGTFGWRDAAALGVAQACALQPGVSRSGVTVTAARALKFERADATRLVFLMSIPIIAGAGLYSFIDIGGLDGIPSDFRAAFLWGMVSSAVTGWVAVWGLLQYVRSRDFSPFVASRVIAGIAVLSIFATSWR